MIATELLMLRHGEACCNHEGVVGGPATCTGLTLIGQMQVEKAARQIKADPRIGELQALYAGPRRRLRETGEIVAPIFNLPMRIDARLDGPVHGTADGRPWSDVKSEFGGGIHVHPDLQWASGSDTWNAYVERAVDGLRELLECHSGERVLLACHGETIMAAFALFLGLSAEQAAACRTDNAALTWWQLERNRFGAERWLLNRHNDTSFRDYPDLDVIG